MMLDCKERKKEKEIKERPPNQDQMDKPGVYSVPCGDCDKFYVGETGLSLGVRLREHKDDVRLHRDSNAIFNHVSSTGHSVNWAGTKLIYNSENTYNRLVVESSLIKHLPNFNSSTGLCAIDNFSKNLILNSDSNISKYLTSL